MKNFLKKLASIAAAIVAAFSVVMPAVVASADDAQTTTTSVMQDLKSDATFNADDYPSKTIDELKAANEEYLQVDRIAESVNDELYIYVYQPSDSTKEIEAAKVSISRLVPADGIDETKLLDDTRVYELKLVSTEGVFDKYLVKDFKVFSSFRERHYTIISLYRESDKELGDDMRESDRGGTTTYVAVRVAKIYYAVTNANGSISYGHTTDEVIVVTDKHHGFIRYSDGFKLWQEPNTDSHFIAFTTDHQIDELLSAVVYCTTERYVYTESWNMFDGYYIRVLDQGNFIDKTIKFLATDKGGNEADGSFSHKYEWERIETISSFREAEESNLSDETKKALQRIEDSADGNGAWVLRFLETRYIVDLDSAIGAISDPIYTQTRVSNVSILKLTFRTAGVSHTMNVVDHMVTPDEVPDGEHGLVEGIQRNYDDWLSSINGWLLELQKTSRMISLAIGAVVLLVAIIGAVIGIDKLVRFIREVKGRRGGG